jgi:hypothetical protein
MSTTANLSTLSNILKEYYLGPVTEQLNNEVLLLTRLESRSEDLVGKYAYVPLHYGRSGGIGAVAEDAALPAAGAQSYQKATYDLKYLYGRVRVTGPSMAKTKNEAGAFLQALKSELDGVRNDLRKDLARQIYGDGTAKIAEVAASWTSGTTLPLTSVEPLRKGQLYVGMPVDIVTISSGTATVAGSTTISSVSVDDASPAIVVASATGVADNAWIVRKGAIVTGSSVTGDGSRSNEIDGIRRLNSVTDNTPFGNLDPSDSGMSWWDNQRITDTDPATGGDQHVLSLDVLQKALNLVRIAGGTPSAMVTTLGLQREFYNLLSDDVRYVDPASLNYAAGFKTLSYNGMPIISDIDAPYGEIHILDESTIKVFSDQDFHFLDQDGQTLRQVADRDAFEAIMVRYMNLGATRRNNQMVISGLYVDGASDKGY